MSEGKTVLLIGSYAPSLLTFRGPLIEAMLARGHRVVAAAPNMSNETKAALQGLGAEPRELPLVNASLNPIGMARAFGQLRALIRDVKPDVSFAYTIKPVILAALAGRAERVPRIVSLITGLGYAFGEGREPKRRVARSAAMLLYRLALARSDSIIFQNPDDQALFRRLWLLRPGQPSHVVNGSGIDLDHFAQAPLPPRPAFLMVARLLKDKGVPEYAEAAKRLKAAHPEVSAALVGYLDPSPDSLTREELDAIVRDGIDFKGQLDDVRPAIADCSVYVLPSAYREGVPRSVLEAMAMGRAIITTDAPGCRETVVQGENGFLVPPHDADALYAAMLTFVETPELARAMGSASRRIAEEKFDVRKVNEDLLGYSGL
jgi:glycosyltransferase involved in cell wall biosynthesis